jgi:hypothetical protein
VNSTSLLSGTIFILELKFLMNNVERFKILLPNGKLNVYLLMIFKKVLMIFGEINVRLLELSSYDMQSKQCGLANVLQMYMYDLRNSFAPSF